MYRVTVFMDRGLKERIQKESGREGIRVEEFLNKVLKGTNPERVIEHEDLRTQENLTESITFKTDLILDNYRVSKSSYVRRAVLLYLEREKGERRAKVKKLCKL